MAKSKQTKAPSIEERLAWDLAELRRNKYLIPVPTYYYQLGDIVTIGNLIDVIISNVYDDGYFYEITYTSIDNNYGNPITHTGQKMIVRWVDIRKQTQPRNDLINNSDLRLNYYQSSLSDLLSKAYHFGIDFDPDYQRDYVWSLEDKVSLIDSIFNNVDIGKFVFIHRSYSDKYLYEVLDGKQRMRAVLDFYEDRFTYKGKHFSDLSKQERYHFTDYPISQAEMNQLTEEQTLRYFVKLNTSGKVMTQEHIDKVKQRLAEISG